MEYKTVVSRGETVLCIKWQDDEQQSAIRVMAETDGIFAEATLGFPNEDARDAVWHSLKLVKAVEGFLALVHKAQEDE